MRENHPSTTEQQLSDLATKLARRSGLDWRLVADQCTELVVFGSQAAGLQTRLSDLDVLLVGTRAMVTTLPRLTQMDLVVRTEKELLSPDWLKSELAGHIAVYGRWLQGVGGWRARALELVRESNDAAEAKQRRVDRLASGLRKYWDRLTPDFRRRNLITLRREKQRFELLRSGFAVPPTRLLDIRAQRDTRLDGFDPHDPLGHCSARIANGA